MHSQKFLKTLKLLTSSFLVMLQSFFTQKALKGHLDTQGTWTHWHFGTQGAWALGYSNTQALEGHFGTRGTLFT